MNSKNKFLNVLEEELCNTAYTENGAKVKKSTGSAVLDFYSKSGSLRSRAEDEIIELFNKAYEEDKTLALKALFQARDIREGNGERRTFRIILKWLAFNHREDVINNMTSIPKYGRYDDLFVLFDTPCEIAMIALVETILLDDISAFYQKEPISLLAKWMPSVNASSKKRREQAAIFIKKSSFNKEFYKKIIKKLRTHLKIVEKKMCENKWNDIEYDKVPSLAFAKYNEAFRKHSPEKFMKFIEDVNNNKKKINASTITPMELLNKMNLYESYRNRSFILTNWTEELQAQWNCLPNYVSKNTNVLVMADTSGSMTGDSMSASIGLALYFAEKNTGAWSNCFMTFSKEPSFVRFDSTDITLDKKVSKIKSIVSSTDLAKALLEILKIAELNKLTQEELPKALLIISDGEFDKYERLDNNRKDFLSSIKEEYKLKGYELPNIISWNVAARNNNQLVTKTTKNIQFVSGYSPTIFKNILAGIEMTPYEAMLKVLCSMRYAEIM